MGDLNQSDREFLVRAVFNENIFNADPDPIPNFQPPIGMTLGEIAKDLGRNPSSIRKRAKKMKLWLEKAWCVSSQGTHQEMWVTNPEGRAALVAWYGGSDG
jgi:hypothetical protein